ncbi:MAG: M48 family metalloprotease [Parabacteroides sp.]
MAQHGAAIFGTTGQSTRVRQSRRLPIRLMARGAVGANVIALPSHAGTNSEADYRDLAFMTMAGYNPDVAVNFWQKMSAGKSGSTPEFMSTHPSDATRIAEIQRALPEIKAKYKTGK